MLFRSFEITHIGGVGSIDYQFNNSTLVNSATHENLGPKTYLVTITDSKNCIASDSIVINEPLPNNNIFPNPASHEANIYFELDNEALVFITLFDSNGNLIKELYQDEAKSGSNVFSFSMEPLRIGTYIVKITADDKAILQEKIIKY